jgi:uncharacterized lipoprotein
MKRSSTFLLAALTALGLAACSPRKETTTTGGTGSETGAMPADTATMAAPAPAPATDTGMGTKTDTGMSAKHDTAVKK